MFLFFSISVKLKSFRANLAVKYVDYIRRHYREILMAQSSVLKRTEKQWSKMKTRVKFATMQALNGEVNK